MLKRDHLIRGAEVAVADIKNAKPSTRRSLGQIISGTSNMDESVGVTVKVSIQQKGSNKNSRLPVYEDLEEMVSDPNVQKIEVRRKADEDARVEKVDLIQHRLSEYSSFTREDISPTSRNILHSTVIKRMQKLYEKG